MPETFTGFPDLYRPTTDFSATTPFNKADLDTEFENIGETLRHLTTLVQALLRDDWSLLDGVVTPESLAQDTSALIAGGQGGDIAALTLLGNALDEEGPATPLTVAEVLELLGIEIASQAEAEAGVDNTKFTTSLRVAQAIAALASGGGGMTGEIVDLVGAGPHVVTAAHYGKTLRTNSAAGFVTVECPQTSTEAIPLPFFCNFICDGGNGTTFFKQGADTLEGKGTSGPQSVTVEGGAVTLYKRVAGSPNTWRLTGELGAS